MTLRLSDDEAAVLRARAVREGRSMNDVARAAIADYCSDHRTRVRELAQRVVREDAELLDRLGQ